MELSNMVMRLHFKYFAYVNDEKLLSGVQLLLWSAKEVEWNKVIVICIEFVFLMRFSGILHRIKFISTHIVCCILRWWTLSVGRICQFITFSFCLMV